MGEEVAALKLVESIEVNTRHYVEILARAVDECMPEPSSDPTYAMLRPRRRCSATQLTVRQIQGRRPGCPDGPATGPESRTC